jgi:predicted rRNA methylase YqxC with S4 and FtsJ domains
MYRKHMCCLQEQHKAEQVHGLDVALDELHAAGNKKPRVRYWEHILC